MTPSELHTERLLLLALSPAQLGALVDRPASLERELGLTLSCPILAARVRQAIEKKLLKLRVAPPAHHLWLTYWLIVIRDTGFGAGLAGFKGAPDAAGEVEIGYGIDPLVRGQGYMTEAVRGLIQWAFAEPRCRAVIAPGTLRTNAASLRVLEKAGMHIYAETPEAFSWRIERNAG